MIVACVSVLYASGVAAHQASDSVSEALVRAHMVFLAGDALNGRGSGTRDELIAASYIAAQFRRLGLRPLGDRGGYLQQVDVSRTQLTATAKLRIGTASYEQGKDLLVLDAGAGTLSGVVRKYPAGAAMRPGSFALLPKSSGTTIPEELSGAAAVLLCETEGLREHWDQLSREPISIEEPKVAGEIAKAPARPRQLRIMLSRQAYEAVARAVEGSMAQFSAVTRTVPYRTWNVLAALSGSDERARQSILLSAHLDHLGAADGVHGQFKAKPDLIFNGADDDASGTTAVLALAEALARGTQPRRTVLFALFGSEENGGFGVRWMIAHPPVPLNEVIANLEFEMIGRPDPKVRAQTLWLTGWERSDLGPALARHGAQLVADPHPDENFFMRSDNIALARRGVVAQTVSSFGLHPQYHQPSDDVAHVDFTHMTQAIRSLVGSVTWLANADFKPTWQAGGRP